MMIIPDPSAVEAGAEALRRNVHYATNRTSTGVHSLAAGNKLAADAEAVLRAALPIERAKWEAELVEEECRRCHGKGGWTAVDVLDGMHVRPHWESCSAGCVNGKVRVYVGNKGD